VSYFRGKKKKVENQWVRGLRPSQAR
jgi:hypothetical protein